MDQASDERARSGWIRQGEIRMNQAEGGFCELLELDCGVLEGGQSSEYVKKPKRAKIEPKRAKLMKDG